MRPYVVGLLGLLTILGAFWLALGERDRDLDRIYADIKRRIGTYSPAVPPAATPAAPPRPSAAPATPAAPAPATAPSPPPRPSFDIVRVNARGDAVMAGRAAPHAEIAILDGTTEIGRVKADDRGEWVFVPTGPMPPGGRELSLRARNPDGSVWDSASTVVLVVPERDRDVAGRAVTPGAPTPPIALLTPRAPGGALQVLQAPRTDTAPPADAPAEAQPSAPGADQAGPAPAAPAPPRPVEAPAGTPTVAPTAPAPTTAPAAPPPPPPPAAPPGPAIAAAPVAAPPPAPARVATPTPPAPAAPAPAPESSTARAPDPPAAPAQVVPRPAGPAPPVAAPALPAAPTIPQGRPPGGISVDVVDYGITGDVSFAGRASPGEAVRLYLDGLHLGDTRADAEGRWNLAPGQPIEPGRTQALRADQVSPDGRVTARVQVPFQRAETPPEGLRPGSIVVQPGHSLWRIARETYGRGIRYTVIYEANREQIRNPDLIYPGQVFMLPGEQGG
jgi:nucleoid-associated protein YgaU